MDKLKSFEIERLLNKYIIKKSKGQTIKYLICWIGYSPKEHKWYSVKDFDHTTELVNKYKKAFD